MATKEQLLAMKGQLLYEACCEIKGMQPLTLDNYSGLPENERQPALSKHKIETVIEVLNGFDKWVADHSNLNQNKWFPIGRFVPGSGWRLRTVYYDNTTSIVGARLESQTSAQARFVFEALIEEYNHMWGNQ